MVSPTVMTVLGPVPADELGVTIAHEHVFFDLRAYFEQAEDDPDGAMAAAPVAPEHLWWLRTHPMNNRETLYQESLDVAVSEVTEFRAAGGSTILDMTTVGIAPNPAGLAEVSRRTGVHIVAGTGYYVAQSLPESVVRLSVEELADNMRRDLLEGFDGAGIRAGFIGELGMSNPLATVELRVLAAAAQVQRELGCVVNIHPGWPAEGAWLTVRAAEEAGLDPARTVMSHLDNRFGSDVAAFREVGQRGFWLEMDCFGRQWYRPEMNFQYPYDAERIRVVLALLDAGFDGQLLFSQDISYRHELVRFGGYGYAHVLRTIYPRLLRSGADKAVLQHILVDNPRRLLTGS